MKILAIGNSFSEDATYYLKKIADSANINVEIVNLYIGGCSLEMHAENIKTNAPAYRYELNGVYTDRSASVIGALQEDDWDIVTVQQVSGLSGIYESYGEDFKTVLNCVKKYAPQAKIYFHETWAYEIDSCHPDFARYNNSQEEMAAAIESTVKKVCKENGNLPIIPSGEIIRKLRQNDAFDYKNGGESLCRDGFHMHIIYGRYLLGLVWFKTLLNGDIKKISFLPSEKDIVNGYEVDDFNYDFKKLQLLKDIAECDLNY